MSIWVTSDLHFNHANIIRYCDRPFKDVEDMNRQLIDNWNRRITDDDRVIVTGDLCMGQVSTIPEIIHQLNGTIDLVPGNHDSKPRMEEYIRLYPRIKINPPMCYEKFKEYFFVFCHLPISNPDLIEQLQEDNKEIIWVSGHTHDKGPFYNPELNNFNVSIDQTNDHPIQLEELVYHLRLYKALKEAANRGEIEHEKVNEAVSRYCENPRAEYYKHKGGRNIGDVILHPVAKQSNSRPRW